MTVEGTWIHENEVDVFACCTSASERKNPISVDKNHSFVRSLVLSILKTYVAGGESKSRPVHCLDLLAGSGINALLWKKHLSDEVDVVVNCQNSEEVVKRNLAKNELNATVIAKDPCIALHERGYNFVYADCTVEASIYFDAILRNMARNGVIIFTTKDDSCLHGGTNDVALRRYGGRIVRTHYASELGIRLFIAALNRTAARYNKAVHPLCCTVHKNTLTIAVITRKGPTVANDAIALVKPLKHCMVCEERAFYPNHFGFPIDCKAVKLNCSCYRGAPGETSLELGPLWSGNIFDADYLEKVIHHNENGDVQVTFALKNMVEEARCPAKEKEPEVKRQKMDSSVTPPFYYNLHKHHPDIAQHAKTAKVIDHLRNLGYRASKTHFDPLAVRTDAPLDVLLGAMKKEAEKTY